MASNGGRAMHPDVARHIAALARAQTRWSEEDFVARVLANTPRAIEKHAPIPNVVVAPFAERALIPRTPNSSAEHALAPSTRVALGENARALDVPMPELAVAPPGSAWALAPLASAALARQAPSARAPLTLAPQDAIMLLACGTTFLLALASVLRQVNRIAYVFDQLSDD